MAKRVVIDARESGTGTGRYVDKLIEYLHKLKPDFEIIVLVKKHRLEFMKQIAPQFQPVESNFKEFTFAEQIGLLRKVRELSPNLVHFSMTQQPVLYRGAAVTTIHDLTALRFTNPLKFWPLFKFKQLVYRYVIKIAAKKSKAIITPSHFVKKDLLKFTSLPEAKISVTYEAADFINSNPEAFEDLEGKKYLLYVGRAQPHKNLNRLLAAYSQLSGIYPDLHLALVGNTDGYYQLLGKSIDKSVADKIVLTGFASEAQLRWLYENCAAYIFPSLSEGFGLPALEAMAHGAPVVASNATCLPEIYGDAAHYFDPTDTDDMSKKIAEVLDQPQLREKLITAGKKQAAKYSWEKMARQTLEIYRSVLNKN